MNEAISGRGLDGDAAGGEAYRTRAFLSLQGENITVLKIICYYLWPIVYFQKPKPSQLVVNVLIQSSTQRD